MAQPTDLRLTPANSIPPDIRGHFQPAIVRGARLLWNIIVEWFSGVR